MIRHALLGSLLIASACNARTTTATNQAAESIETVTLVEQAIDARITACMADGLSRESCECIARTSSRVLSEQDFLTESELKLGGNQSALDEFLRRKYAEDRSTMFELGQALQDCPASRVPADMTQ